MLRVRCKQQAGCGVHVPEFAHQSMRTSVAGRTCGDYMGVGVRVRVRIHVHVHVLFQLIMVAIRGGHKA